MSLSLSLVTAGPGGGAVVVGDSVTAGPGGVVVVGDVVTAETGVATAITDTKRRRAMIIPAMITKSLLSSVEGPVVVGTGRAKIEETKNKNMRRSIAAASQTRTTKIIEM